MVLRFQPIYLATMSNENEDEYHWPPQNSPRSWLTAFKRLQCRLRKNHRLIWFRDIDGETNLSVARPDKDGNLIAPRFWPNYRFMKLNDNGTVVSVVPKDENHEYVVHWIAENNSEQMLMFIKNHDVYQKLEK